MPPPIIFGHVTQRSIDATLCGDRVRSRGEQFGYARGFESCLCEAHGGTQTGSACAHDDGTVLRK